LDKGFVLCWGTWPSTWSPGLPRADGNRRGPPGGLDHNLPEVDRSSGSKKLILLPPEIIVIKISTKIKFKML